MRPASPDRELRLLTILDMKVRANNPDGTPIRNRYGRPLYEVEILTKEIPDQWIVGKLPFDPRDESRGPKKAWKVGGEPRELEIEVKRYGAETTYRMHLPTRGDSVVGEILEEVQRGTDRLDKLEHALVDLGIGQQELRQLVHDLSMFLRDHG
jgi:hypothetical protein